MNRPMNMDRGRSIPGIPPSSGSPAESELLNKARHDIRTAMHVVTGMSEILSHSGTVGVRDREIAATLLRNAERALALMESMFESLGEETAHEARTPRALSQPRSERQGADRQEAPAAENAPARLRALVVEDDESNALVISAFLEALKYDIDFATSGEEALEKFSRGHYDVIMMDVQMRGMDGLEATRRIRDIEDSKDLFPTPILGCTGKASKADAFFCAKAGMTDCMSKPFSRRELEKKLICALPLFGRRLC